MNVVADADTGELHVPLQQKNLHVPFFVFGINFPKTWTFTYTF